MRTVFVFLPCRQWPGTGHVLKLTETLHRLLIGAKPEARSEIDFVGPDNLVGLPHGEISFSGSELGGQGFVPSHR